MSCSTADTSRSALSLTRRESSWIKVTCFDTLPAKSNSTSLYSLLQSAPLFVPRQKRRPPAIFLYWGNFSRKACIDSRESSREVDFVCDGLARRKALGSASNGLTGSLFSASVLLTCSLNSRRCCLTLTPRSPKLAKQFCDAPVEEARLSWKDKARLGPAEFPAERASRLCRIYPAKG